MYSVPCSCVYTSDFKPQTGKQVHKHFFNCIKFWPLEPVLWYLNQFYNLFCQIYVQSECNCPILVNLDSTCMLKHLWAFLLHGILLSLHISCDTKSYSAVQYSKPCAARHSIHAMWSRRDTILLAVISRHDIGSLITYMSVTLDTFVLQDALIKVGINLRSCPNSSYLFSQKIMSGN